MKALLAFCILAVLVNTAPSQPLNVKANSLSFETIKVTWTAPKVSPQDLVGYRVNCSEFGGKIHADKRVSANNTEVICDYLIPNTTYQVEVTELFTNNTTGPRTTVSAKTAPVPPLVVQVKAFRPASIAVYWNRSSASPKSLEYYKIIIKNTYYSSIQVQPDVESVTFKADQNSEYVVVVAEIYRDKVIRRASPNIKITTTGTLDVTAKLFGPNKVNITWKVVALNENGYVAEKYHVGLYYQGKRLKAKTVGRNITGQMFDVSLMPNTTYEARVQERISSFWPWRPSKMRNLGRHYSAYVTTPAIRPPVVTAKWLFPNQMEVSIRRPSPIPPSVKYYVININVDYKRRGKVYRRPVGREVFRSRNFKTSQAKGIVRIRRRFIPDTNYYIKPRFSSAIATVEDIAKTTLKDATQAVKSFMIAV